MFYYSEDQKTFLSKVEALEYRAKTGKSIYFYYYDHVYSKLDWKVEPPESLDYYYKEQALRLREKYDYLILCYSGGFDSTNILETFYYNGIPLDKIVIVGAFSQDSISGVDENHNGELYKNAFPYLEKLGLTSIAEKYDYTTMFDNVDKNFSLMKYGSDWIDKTGGWFSPHNWFWHDVEKYVIPKNIGSKKVGLIFGKDKPILVDTSFRFSDTPANSYGNAIGTDNCDRINFYWDPEYTNILLKQIHILKKVKIAGLVMGYDNVAGAQTFGGVDINRIVYDLKQPLLFKSPKSKTNILSLRDRYLSEKTNSETYSRYIDGIQNMNKRIDIKAIEPVRSRFYEV